MESTNQQQACNPVDPSSNDQTAAPQASPSRSLPVQAGTTGLRLPGDQHRVMVPLPCEFRVVMRRRPSPQRVVSTTTTAHPASTEPQHMQTRVPEHTSTSPRNSLEDYRRPSFPGPEQNSVFPGNSLEDYRRPSFPGPEQINAPTGSFGYTNESGGLVNENLPHNTFYGDDAQDPQFTMPLDSFGNTTDTESGNSYNDHLVYDAPFGIDPQNPLDNTNRGAFYQPNGSGEFNPELSYTSAYGHASQDPLHNANGNSPAFYPSDGSQGTNPYLPYTSPHDNAAQDPNLSAPGIHANTGVVYDAPLGVDRQGPRLSAPGGSFGYPPGPVHHVSTDHAAQSAIHDGRLTNAPASPHQAGHPGNPSSNTRPSAHGLQPSVPAPQTSAKKLRTRWSPAELVTLEQLLAIRPAVSDKEIGAILGKSANAIYLKRCRKYRGMFKKPHKSDKARELKRQGGGSA